MRCPLKRKKILQFFQNIGIYPAFDVLPIAVGFNQARPTQLFDMMGHCRRYDIQILTDIPHTCGIAGVDDPNGSGLAAGRQANKNL